MVVPDGFLSLDVHKVAAFGGQLFVELAGNDLDALALGEAAGGALHNGEGFRKNLIQNYFNGFVLVLYQFVALAGQSLFLRDGEFHFQFLLNLGDTVFEGLLDSGDLLLQGLGPGAEFVIGEPVNLRIHLENLIQDRLDSLHIAV